jgi:CBS domain-containing protein
MDRNPPVVSAETTVVALADRIAQGDPAVARRQGTLVVDTAGELTGMVTRADILRAVREEVSATTLTVGEVASRDVAVTHPEETLHDALARMIRRNIGRLAVVEAASPRRVVGYLGRADILAARLRRHEEEEHRERGPLLGSLKIR